MAGAPILRRLVAGCGSTLALAAAIATTAAAAEPLEPTLPFQPNCAAMQAYFNGVGRHWTPPVQVEDLGNWITDDGYVACGSGVAVRYLNSSLQVCPLTGESQWPYTALEYIAARKEFRVRTDRCQILPARALPVAAAGGAERPPARSRPGGAWRLPLLAAASLGGLAGAAALARRWRARRRTSRPVPPRTVLQEDVGFLLSDLPEPLPPVTTDGQP
jgi:hypothetical protein